MIPVTLPDLGAGLGLVSATDTVRVAAPPPTDPTDEGYADQQPGDYGAPVLCSVDDLRARRIAGTTPTGQEDFKITSTAGIGVTQADQLIEWTANADGDLAVPFVLRSLGREIPPNSASDFWTCYATGRD